MNRTVSLPPEFSELNGKVDFVIKRGHNEYSSSCPQCGGFVHQDGSYPDRFRLFIASEATGKPLGWCRSCGFTFWPGKTTGARWTPTP
jgi:hypothetical protein